MQALERLDLARVLPRGASVPSWARCGLPWPASGHRLLVPVYDASGVLRSLRAWRLDGQDPKRVAPAGHSTAGLVLANAAGRQLLATGQADVDLVVVEGEPDFLTWALASEGHAVLGIVAHAWTPALAARLPDGARVALRVHRDAAGDKYAAALTTSLAERCALYDFPRPSGGEHQDENEKQQAGELPADPFDGLSRQQAEEQLPEDGPGVTETPPPSGVASVGRGASWLKRLLKRKDKQGKRTTICNVANLETILSHSPEWAGAIAYNEFLGRVVITRESPAHTGLPGQSFPRPWTDADDVHATIWFQREWRLEASPQKVKDAVLATAHQRHVHPVREYLDGLVWDGTPRVARWLTSYTAAEDTPYARGVGQRWMISAVARIYQPGCKVDTMLILEGKQGARKSSLLRALAVRPEWFSDQIPDLGSKDAFQGLVGKWINEHAELDALARAEVTRVKAFVSKPSDHYRPAYGRHPVDVPRQGIFAGTTNTDDYLRDPTGGRRFWPVKVAAIDLGAVERDVDQLWAEAVSLFRAGVPWWVDTDELAAAATLEQDARFQEDPWQEAIARYAETRTQVAISSVLEAVLDLKLADWGQSEKNRVAHCLIRLGWVRKLVREGKSRVWYYVRRAESGGPDVTSHRSMAADLEPTGDTSE